MKHFTDITQLYSFEQQNMDDNILLLHDVMKLSFSNIISFIVELNITKLNIVTFNFNLLVVMNYCFIIIHCDIVG